MMEVEVGEEEEMMKEGKPFFNSRIFVASQMPQEFYFTLCN
jgi:hypothetical protein